jgi:2-amino-4-hydroxy-6-hydroxymethyldihydropteridine diphosphokinase
MNKSGLDVATHVAYIGIGSNLGDRYQYLRDAVEALRQVGTVRCSAVYETEPVGYAEQPQFLNMVVELATELKPLPLLERLMEIEREHGRVRSIRYGPRTLDLDILLYDNDYICFRNLQVPHPRMWQRAFVLVPLADLVPDRRGLGGHSIKTMADRLLLGGGIRRVGCVW